MDAVDTTNPDVSEVPEEAQGVDTEAEQQTPELDENGEPIEQVEADPDEIEDELDGIKVKGKKDLVEKLKAERLMHADYTRKTQEAAEIRRAAEAERTQYAQANAEQVRAMATLVSMDQQLQQMQQIDFQALNQQDPVKAQELFFQMQQLKDNRQQFAGQLQQMEQQRTFEAQRLVAKQIEEGDAVLKRDIPGWGPEVGKKVFDFATKELGANPGALSNLTDPVLAKAFYYAMVGKQALAKQKEGARSTPDPIKPVSKVSGNNAGASKDMNRLSVDEWMRARNDQLRKSKGR